MAKERIKTAKERTWRLLQGVHHEAGKTYLPGAVFRSDKALEKHNYPGSVRFQLVQTPSTTVAAEGGDSTDAEDLPEATAAPLDSLTEAGLRKLAEDRGIALTGVRGKRAVLAAVKAALSEPEEAE